MPIDASIPLSGNTQQPNLIGQAAQAFTLKSAMLDSQRQEREQQDQQLLKQALSDPSGFDTDPQSGVPMPKPETMQKLYSISPTAATKLGEATQKMRGEAQQQAERKQRMEKARDDQAGPILGALATEYEETAKKGDKDAAWAAIKPKIDAANQQFEAIAKQTGLPFKPLTNAQDLEMAASHWSKYSERQMRSTQPETPHERKTLELSEKRADLADKKFETLQKSIDAKLKGDEDKKLAPEELNFMARQALRGDTSVFQNIGRGRQGADNIKALRGEIMREAKKQNIQPEQLAAINAEFQGLKAGERTLGTRTANIEMAVTEAQNMAPLALQASEKVDRTKYPKLNDFLIAAEKGTGGEDVVRLGIATNSLINIYARAISPTGVPTVSDKDHARELLSSAWSKGQYKVGVDQLMKEMDAARKSPGQVRQSFREAIQGDEGGAGGRPDNPASGGGQKRFVYDAASGTLKPQ